MDDIVPPDSNDDAQSVNDWQIAQIRKGIEQADRGEFASPEKVQSVIDKWARKAR
jgi:predicted transcriptional regulator